MRWFTVIALLFLLSCHRYEPPACIVALELEADGAFTDHYGDDAEKELSKIFSEVATIVATELNVRLIATKTIINDHEKYDPVTAFEDLPDEDINGVRVVVDFLPEGSRPWGVPWMCYQSGDLCGGHAYNAVALDVRKYSLRYYLVGCILHELGHAFGMTHDEKECSAMSVCRRWYNGYSEGSKQEFAEFIESGGCCTKN